MRGYARRTQLVVRRIKRRRLSTVFCARRSADLNIRPTLRAGSSTILSASSGARMQIMHATCAIFRDISALSPFAVRPPHTVIADAGATLPTRAKISDIRGVNSSHCRLPASFAADSSSSRARFINQAILDGREIPLASSNLRFQNLFAPPSARTARADRQGPRTRHNASKVFLSVGPV
jgi:hypothetical protein